MPAPSLSDIKKIVGFTLFPASIIRTDFSNVEVLAFLDAESAFQFIDPVSMHLNVLPTLPMGAPQFYNEYQYLKVRLPNGTVTCVGLPWIDNNTYGVVTGTRLRATILNTSPEKRTQLIAALTQAGFTEFSIENLP